MPVLEFKSIEKKCSELLRKAYSFYISFVTFKSRIFWLRYLHDICIFSYVNVISEFDL